MFKLSRISFTGRMVGLILFAVLVVGGATFCSSYYYFTKSFDEQAEERIDLAAAAVQGTLDDLSDKLKRLAVSFSTRPDVAEAVDRQDTKRLQSLGKEMRTHNDLDVLTFDDPTGKVIARGYSDKTGDSIANQINVKKA